ncbi:MAG: SUMF1/EgtB/PvdO family nonheme iron enzyme [Alphaproteobacteria bacterium]|nr:SUMF1/EgtB/PvdO family nonheme iron enzyme [Alphaproteobacteria bacterium]
MPLNDDTLLPDDPYGPVDPPDADIDLSDLSARYHGDAEIGRGGMGRIVRVIDRWFGRTVVRKEMLPGRDPARFEAEAAITARLQHPAVVPVHDRGRLPDGRPFYTMTEVSGVTLERVITDRRRPDDPDALASLRGLVDVLARASAAVAFAHSMDIIHRDLKPANVMLDEDDRVYVMDWGLARILDQPDVLTPTRRPRSPHTRDGDLLGTPHWMSPEQARGAQDQVGKPTDVWALGAILYTILTGHKPYAQGWTQVYDGPPRDARTLGSEAGLAAPDDLIDLCMESLAMRPAERPTAAAFARCLTAWLEGALERQRALRQVDEADALLPIIRRHRDQAASLSEKAQAILKELPAYAPVDLRRGAWALEDDTRSHLEQADLMELRYLETLRAALNHFPGLPEAIERLADYYRDRHATAEAAGDTHEARRFEALLEGCDLTRHRDYLEGTGSFTLHTDPAGATVTLYALEEQDRRLVLGQAKARGKTPLHAVPLSMGRYIAELAAPGHATVSYPVYITRKLMWDGAPPGEAAPQAVPLLRTDDLGLDDCYIPPGWFWCGGDRDAPRSLPMARRWLDGFVMRRYAVTHTEYLEFLNDLLAQGMDEEAVRHAPRDFGADLDACFYGRDADGRFVMAPDAEGDDWDPQWPVVNVTWYGARAFARWTAARAGLPWRLPAELEWEKAARGADRRLFPWGDSFDATWCQMGLSNAGAPSFARVRETPLDRSPYGVEGLAGNVVEWCADAYSLSGEPMPEAEDAMRVMRGGGWSSMPWLCRSATRFPFKPGHRSQLVGFRLARSLL